MWRKVLETKEKGKQIDHMRLKKRWTGVSTEEGVKGQSKSAVGFSSAQERRVCEIRGQTKQKRVRLSKKRREAEDRV